jgi:hypothetical protein
VLHALELAGTTQTQAAGNIPSTINFGGTTINNNTVLAWSGLKYVANIYYKNDLTVGAYTGQMYCVYIQNIAIPGLVSSPGAWGTYDAVCMSVVDRGNGILQKYCGGDTNTPVVPQKYLPSGCNCTNIWNFSCT